MSLSLRRTRICCSFYRNEGVLMNEFVLQDDQDMLVERERTRISYCEISSSDEDEKEDTWRKIR